MDINALPDELLLHIFDFFTAKELLLAFRLNKRFCYLSYTDDIWRRIARLSLSWKLFNESDPAWSSYYKFYQLNEAELREDIYNQTIVLQKWEKAINSGLFWVTVEDNEEPDPTWTRALECQNDLLFAAKNSQELSVYGLWNLTYCHTVDMDLTPTCMTTMSASFDAKKVRLFVGSNTGSICAVDFLNAYAQKVQKINLYTEDVKISSIHCDPNHMQLFVGTQDIELFSITQTTISSVTKIELNNFANPATSIATNDKAIYAAFADGLMTVFDRETLQPVKSIMAHKAYFERLRYYRDTLITSSRDETIKFWDSRDHTLKPELELSMPNTNTVTDFQINDWSLVASTGSGSVWFWDLRYQQPVSVSQITEEPLFSVARSDNMIFTGGAFPLVYAKS